MNIEHTRWYWWIKTNNNNAVRLFLYFHWYITTYLFHLVQVFFQSHIFIVPFIVRHAQLHYSIYFPSTLFTFFHFQYLNSFSMNNNIQLYLLCLYFFLLLSIKCRYVWITSNDNKSVKMSTFWKIQQNEMNSDQIKSSELYTEIQKQYSYQIETQLFLFLC